MRLARFFVSFFFVGKLDWTDPRSLGRRVYDFWRGNGGSLKPDAQEDWCHFWRVLLFWAPRRWLSQAKMNAMVRPWAVLPFLVFVALVGYVFYFHTGTALSVLFWTIGIVTAVALVLIALALIGWVATDAESAKVVAFRLWLKTVLGPVVKVSRRAWTPFDRVFGFICPSEETGIGLITLCFLISVVAWPFIILAAFVFGLWVFAWTYTFWFVVTVTALVAAIALAGIWMYLRGHHPQVAAGISICSRGFLNLLLLPARVLIAIKRFSCPVMDVGEIPVRDKETA